MKTSINLERMITLDVIALDVSNGRSYVVHYSDNKCLFEGWMIHNQEGLNGLLARAQLCQTVPEIVLEATGESIQESSNASVRIITLTIIC